MSIFSLVQYNDKYNLTDIQIDEENKQISWRVDFNMTGGMPQGFYDAFHLVSDENETGFNTVHWVNFYVFAKVINDKLEISADYTIMYTGGREEVKDYEVSIDEKLSLAGKMEEDIGGSVYKYLMGERTGGTQDDLQ